MALEVLCQTIPMTYQKILRNVVIIMSVLKYSLNVHLAQAQVWSKYRHNLTAKFLISITSQGQFHNVSEAGCQIKR